jgi:hypothetical protein
MEGKTKINLRKMVGGCGFDSSGSEYRRMTGCCEDGNECSVPTQGEKFK